MDDFRALPRPTVDTSTPQYQEIMAGFRIYLLTNDAARALPSPRAYTCYRGVPVASEAVVVEADTDQVTFKVNRYQANVLSRTGFALIKSPFHGVTFRAYLDQVDNENYLASFNLFERHGEGADRRRNVRFQPTEDNQVEMSFGKTSMLGTLLDVSTFAIAVFVRDADPALLQAGQCARLSGGVTGQSGFKLNGRGVIKRILAWAGDDPKEFRIVLELDIREHDRSTIANYVAYQQSEVLRAMNC